MQLFMYSFLAEAKSCRCRFTGKTLFQTGPIIAIVKLTVDLNSLYFVVANPTISNRNAKSPTTTDDTLSQYIVFANVNTW